MTKEWKRWTAKVVYRSTKRRIKVVVHEVDELEELQGLIEAGPCFGSIKSFEIKYNGEKMTIAESKKL